MNCLPQIWAYFYETFTFSEAFQMFSLEWPFTRQHILENIANSLFLKTMLGSTPTDQEAVRSRYVKDMKLNVIRNYEKREK